MQKKVFISYAWENTEIEKKELKDFIIWLSKSLEKSGIKVFLDTQENKPGSNLENYMKNGIECSEFIICICTEMYKNKMEIQGTGVNKEIELLKKNLKLESVIPLIRKGEFQFLPDIFKDRFVSEFDFKHINSDYNTKQFIELNRAFEDEIIEPENYKEQQINDIRKINQQANLEANCHHSPATEAKITFNYVKCGGTFVIGSNDYEFVTNWTPYSNDAIYTYSDYCACYFVRNFIDFSSIKSSDLLINLKKEKIVHVKKCSVGDGIIWINSQNNIALGRILDVKYDFENELNSTLTLEYKILNPLERVKDLII